MPSLAPHAESTPPVRAESAAAPGRAHVEYDLHGLVGIRLVDASPADAVAVDRQLGPIRATLEREPDITIRFVDRLALTGPVRRLGLDEAGFTDDAFLVLRGKHKSRARVQIDFGQIGERCEIVCESGLVAVPLLIPILNLTALGRGALPLHASAFEWEGTGVLTTGWSKGGKTEALLAFMAQGARYIGDEWVYLSGDGGRMGGIPEPIRVWDWHLDALPVYRERVRAGDRARLGLLHAAQALARGVSHAPGAGLPPARLLGRMRPLLARAAHVDLHPKRLFNRELGSLSGDLHKIFFVGTHESPDIALRRLDPAEIARRMVFSLQYERLPFMSWYLTYRFAFPDRRCELLEHAEELQRERLTRILEGHEAFALDHPYPVSLTALFEAMRRVL